MLFLVLTEKAKPKENKTTMLKICSSAFRSSALVLLSSTPRPSREQLSWRGAEQNQSGWSLRNVQILVPLQRWWEKTKCTCRWSVAFENCPYEILNNLKVRPWKKKHLWSQSDPVCIAIRTEHFYDVQWIQLRIRTNIFTSRHINHIPPPPSQVCIHLRNFCSSFFALLS